MGTLVRARRAPSTKALGAAPAVGVASRRGAGSTNFSPRVGAGTGASHGRNAAKASASRIWTGHRSLAPTHNGRAPACRTSATFQTSRLIFGRTLGVRGNEGTWRSNRLSKSQPTRRAGADTLRIPRRAVRPRCLYIRRQNTRSARMTFVTTKLHAQQELDPVDL
jgi:hypothetical protein